MKKGSLKRMLGIGLSLVLALGLAGCGGTAPSTKETPQGAAQGSPEGKQVKIGIIQIVEHPALDAARQGFLDVLKAKGYEEGKNLKLEYKNAQNDQSMLNSIAQQFASSDLDLILAIATPSAQAMASATDEIPILITAVTDPVEAKLVDSMDKPGGNITGTTDMNPIKEQLDLLKKLVPDAKTVGVIYNAAEVNSEVQVRIVKQEAPALGLQIVEATVASSADVLQAAQSLIGKVNAIYVPTDNMVVSAAQSVVQVANENKIPLISGESSVVDAGGLGTIGINYTNLGAQTGEMALRILDGAKPADMSVEGQKNFDIVLNKEAIDLLGIKVPADIKSKATIK
ncbi:sugar ABC transporter substrate-binding protein [Desulfitobacterium hafniense]|uniref:Sugar ABC transporter substrate-binding protein n=1 Tax=Desulfitobacterium hafniense TaxID=49338 RepID=A0A0W1JHP8_DESHA|nr:ABC transporter substrate-binding protein [Desulfitobacterium hafniense]KTE91117.1 sugar ABC transporter substrate-binding protein [Desulfitobacterium hafniense]